MKAAVILDAEARETRTQGDVRQLRRDGKVPAILYGEGGEPVKVTLDENVLTHTYKKGGFMSKVVEIKTSKESFFTIPRDMQFHPVSDKILHADFQRVNENSVINVFVPVHLTGQEKCIGLKRGGVLNIVRHDVELLCSPANIPAYIEADVREMEIGDSLHISGFKLPEGVTPAIKDRDFTVATIAGRAAKDDDEDKPATEAAEGAAEGEKKEEKAEAKDKAE